MSDWSKAAALKLRFSDLDSWKGEKLFGGNKNVEHSSSIFLDLSVASVLRCLFFLVPCTFYIP